MKMKTISSAIVFLLLAFSSYSQTYTTALDRYLQARPQEKLYFHFDKSYYTAGETIWLKAYLFSGGLPSSGSKNLHIELLHKNGSGMFRGTYPVTGATLSTGIEIPDSLQQGYYILRAFTPSMLNDQSPEFYYTTPLFIFHPDHQPADAEKPALDTQVRLQFFPESGHLVDGLLTVVAFKAVDSRGRPVELSGEIRADDGFSVPFKTTHDGMGQTRLKAYSRKKYKAVVHGLSKEFELPAVQPSGINLAIQEEKNGRSFVISRSKTGKEAYQKLMLVAQINHMVVYENEISFDEFFSIRGHLLTDSLPSGILHFTVFSKDGLPLAERLCFINNEEYRLPFELATLSRDPGKRGENNMELRFSDPAQKTLSVSITDISFKQPYRDHIISRLLLTSDLKGPVNHPSWYFEKSDSVKKALDNLMLTQGWSRFEWKTVLNPQPATARYEDPYLITLSGKVKDEKGREVKGGVLQLSMQQRDTLTMNYEVMVQPDGRFRLDSLEFYGNTRFSYTYFSLGEKRNVTIQTDTLKGFPGVPAPPVVFLPSDPRTSFHQDFRRSIRSDTMSRQMDTVVLQVSNRRPLEVVNEKYTSSLFRSMGKINLDNINQPANDRALGVIEYITNTIRQVEFKGDRFVSGKNMSLFKRMEVKIPEAVDAYGNPVYEEAKSGRSAARAKEPPPTGNVKGDQYVVDLFLNEVPVDLASLRPLRMDEIALVKYYDPGFIGSSSAGSGGTIAIYTKRKDYEPVRVAGAQHFYFKGYAVKKEFYQPDYSKPAPEHEREDLRPTLYWNPSIFLNEENKTFKFRFYNNDISKKLLVVVEGFSADGKLIYLEKTIGD